MQHQRNPNNVYFIYERRSRPLKSSAERSSTSRTLLASAEGSSSSGDLLTSAERSPWSDFAERLPPEMSVRIFSELDAQSLVSAAQTCRLWNRLVQEVDALWKKPCLSVRTFCQREVDRDRTDGLSWKVTLVRNYQRSFLKRDWLRGRYSNVMSADDLRDRKWCPLDLETWGEILEAELER